jgi:hypothetical protein
MNFQWHGQLFSQYVNHAATQALTSGGHFGRHYWDMTVPIGTDPRSSGDLRHSWFDEVTQFGDHLSLTFGARTRYAIYVELGTTKMAPRAPVRKTAAEITAILPSYFRNELNH